ncbi:MAG TPA: FAD-dependent oxidoreductase [Clostridia bacterium]|nr:FAD-dependent oxidoreductase [Clostridia bacterium]HPQ46876.1 FAD-dependent oxidoreductase [Clostridia bacterium]HRX43018.1 FAD-dependent oxidoreductase [Clostridia bacterium]
MEKMKVDILVAGGGSAGFGAAYNACRFSNGRFTVVMIDSNPTPGGTSVHAGVNAWEMGIGGPGIHDELAARLLKKKGSAAIQKGHWKTLTKEWPFAISSPDVRYVYEDTLKAAGVHDRFGNHNNLVFEPGSMSLEMLRLLREAGQNKFLFIGNERIEDVALGADSRISSVTTDMRCIEAGFVIDCTGDIMVSRLAGCSTVREQGINGVTQVYRVTPKKDPGVDEIPTDIELMLDDREFSERLDNVRVISSINTYPNGDLNINQLPTMDGDEFFAMPMDEARNKCTGRVYLHWKRIQEDTDIMKKYRLKHVFPMIGIRESHRLDGDFILDENEVLAGFAKQKRADEAIAFSDHPIDIHGGDSPGIKILDVPYGIPYGCMLPKEVSNMLVACRGASFTRTAAASCRLSRTMISLGEAAGCAAVHCIENSMEASEADRDMVRDSLGIRTFTDRLAVEYGL